MCLAILDAGIKVFLVLTNDDDIHVRMLGIDKRIVGNTGSYIGIESQHDAGGDVEALVPATLWSGDGSFQKYPGAPQRFPSAWLNTGADATQIDFLAHFDGLNFDASPRCLYDMQGRLHDFWPDAISVCNGYGGVFYHENISPSFIFFPCVRLFRSGVFSGPDGYSGCHPPLSTCSAFGSSRAPGWLH